MLTTDQLIAKAVAAKSKTLGLWDQAKLEQIICSGTVPDGATVVAGVRTLVYRGQKKLDVVNDAGALLQTVELDDAKMQDILVQYAIAASFVGTSMGRPA